MLRRFLDGAERRVIPTSRRKPYSPSTLHRMRQAAEYRLLPQFGAKCPSDLTTPGLRRFVATLLEEVLSPSSVQHRQAVVGDVPLSMGLSALNGHATIQQTMDLHGHLMPDHLDRHERFLSAFLDDFGAVARRGRPGRGWYHLACVVDRGESGRGGASPSSAQSGRAPQSALHA